LIASIFHWRIESFLKGLRISKGIEAEIKFTKNIKKDVSNVETKNIVITDLSSFE
jgi:hypothetical protein